MSLYSSKHLAIFVWFLILCVGTTNARVAERDAEDGLDKAATNVSNLSKVYCVVRYFQVTIFETSLKLLYNIRLSKDGI